MLLTKKKRKNVASKCFGVLTKNRLYCTIMFLRNWSLFASTVTNKGSPLKSPNSPNSFGGRTRITMQCNNGNCQNSIPLSNPKSAEAQKLNNSGGQSSGIGRRGLETITACKDTLPPFANRAFSEHTEAIDEVAAIITDRKLVALYMTFMANCTHKLSM